MHIEMLMQRVTSFKDYAYKITDRPSPRWGGQLRKEGQIYGAKSTLTSERKTNASPKRSNKEQ